MVQKVVSIRVWVFLYIYNHHIEVVIPFFVCQSSDSFLWTPEIIGTKKWDVYIL